MSKREILCLSPLLIAAAGPVVTLMAIALRRHHGLTLALALAFLGAAAAALVPVAGLTPQTVTPLLRIDGYSLFLMALVFLSAMAVAAMAHPYLEQRSEQREEFYVLLLVSTLGAGIMVASVHFASFFLGLETMSIGLYGMIAYLRAQRSSVEAGLKYVILAGASSAFLLFGIALIYAETGTMEFHRMGQALTRGDFAGTLTLAGIAFLLTGAGFKLALVPFHMWAPDVYAGAPAPVTAFIATVSKGAVFGALIRFFLLLDGFGRPALFVTVALLAAASLLVGKLLALLQRNLKRLLAYSSIAHVGYLMVAFLAAGPLALESALFYLVAYSITLLAAFGVVSALPPEWEKGADLTGLEGLFWTRPGLAGTLALSLFSLAGIPLTAGFVAKFHILASAVNSSLWTLSVLLVLSSAIGLFYYLRVIVLMVSPAPGPLRLPLRPRPSVLVLSVLALLLVALGVYPHPLQALIRLTALTLP